MRNRGTPRITAPRELPKPRSELTCRHRHDRRLAEHAAAVNVYNAQVLELGVFADTLRAF
jgi:hypothetical protein